MVYLSHLLFFNSLHSEDLYLCLVLVFIINALWYETEVTFYSMCTSVEIYGDWSCICLPCHTYVANIIYRVVVEWLYSQSDLQARPVHMLALIVNMYVVLSITPNVSRDFYSYCRCASAGARPESLTNNTRHNHVTVTIIRWLEPRSQRFSPPPVIIIIVCPLTLWFLHGIIMNKTILY